MTNVTYEPTSETVTNIIGVSYILTCIIFNTLHVLCSYLMWQDPEMRNPTYQFIINLSIADFIELLILGLYAGIVILLKQPPVYWLDRVMAWICLSAWYANCVLFAFIAFSRWIAMTKSHLVGYLFRKRALYMLHIVPWIIIAVFYFITVVAYPEPTFYFYPEFFTWGFDIQRPLGEYLHWHNFTFNGICAAVEMTFNIMSLHWVHVTRKEIQSIATLENRRRETKLLIQCFILGCVFTMASVMFTIVFAVGVVSPMVYLGMQALWTFNHCVNPLVYLTVNTKLRRKLIKLVTRGRYGIMTTKVGHSAVGPASITAVPGRNAQSKSKQGF